MSIKEIIASAGRNRHTILLLLEKIMELLKLEKQNRTAIE